MRHIQKTGEISLNSYGLSLSNALFKPSSRFRCEELSDDMSDKIYAIKLKADENIESLSKFFKYLRRHIQKTGEVSLNSYGLSLSNALFKPSSRFCFKELSDNMIDKNIF